MAVRSWNRRLNQMLIHTHIERMRHTHIIIFGVAKSNMRLLWQTLNAATLDRTPSSCTVHAIAPLRFYHEDADGEKIEPEGEREGKHGKQYSTAVAGKAQRPADAKCLF